MTEKSIIKEFLTGYEITEKSFENSTVMRASLTFKSIGVSGSGSGFTRWLLHNPVSVLLGRITKGLSHVKMKSYGLIMLILSLVNAVLSFGGYYFGHLDALPLSNLITCGVLFVISIPASLSEHSPDGITVSSGRLVSLIFETLCLKRSKSTFDSTISVPGAISVLIGAALGVLGYFVPLISILSVIFALIYFVLAVKSPEFSFMTTLLILPFLPAMDHGGALLAALVCLTVASFAFKVLLGKRVFHFEQYDLILLLFFIFILVSGIFNKGFGSFESAAMMIILAFGYFLSGNILVNRRLADNAAKMIIFSSFITATLAIFSFTVHPMMKPEWIDSHFGGIINARMTAFFGNPNIYAVFLLTPLIFSLTFTLDKTRGAARLYYLLVFLLNSVAMLFTYTRGAWLALVLAVPAFFIIHGKRTPKLLLLPVLGIPLCAAFLPQSFTDRFLSIFNAADSSVQSRLSTWRASLSMFFDNFFTGVGIGEESFREEFAIYSENGLLSGGNHAHNLWLEIGCEAGIFALLLFMLLPIVRARHIATYKHYISSVSLNTSITMTSVTVFALLAFGMTDYIWYSSPLYYLFWVVFGMGSAMLRIGKREYDELIDYRYSGSSAYKASIDIGVAD